MALGVADHIWTIAEAVRAALESSDVPPLPRPTPETTLKPSYHPFRLMFMAMLGALRADLDANRKVLPAIICLFLASVSLWLNRPIRRRH
jgi:hypothetical protein